MSNRQPTLRARTWARLESLRDRVLLGILVVVVLTVVVLGVVFATRAGAGTTP